MYYSYTPTYYSSLHDTITTLCKNILPFSFKKKRLTGLTADQKLAKQQSENLKWQQESFHRILNLIGLHKEGIVPESEVSAFRIHLLETLIASPADLEQPTIIRDKLLFLQELFYAKCISMDEYHSSKRPLLQRMAVQGAVIDARDVIVAGSSENPVEEWSVIQRKDEEFLMDKDRLQSKTKPKNRTPMKPIKGAAVMIDFGSSHKLEKNEGMKGEINPIAESLEQDFRDFEENPFWDFPSKEMESESRPILMSESSPPVSIMAEKEGGSTVKKKPFRALFQREQRDENAGDWVQDRNEAASKMEKKQWGFNGLKKWKRSNPEDETTPLPLGERSDDHHASSIPCELIHSPIGVGPTTKSMKKIHSDGSAPDFCIDKALGENIKKELSRIQTELNTKNPNLQFSNNQVEAISTRLPADKAELKKFFPKSWCDRHGDVVLDVVRKEFNDHVGEIESKRNAAKERHGDSVGWVTFEDNNENSHPNFFAAHHL
ncbi:PREDICTED: uncharacterized protein LOC104603390 [Nelumbo nucifera]|uniref:Uncharacterized protein LOC104603390 n=1 Tax=Nelumbo nucifera TaxID=4432 RepID=A0A1U8ADW4_NELNU|nr:PREDICTED: uncharacterized protein LOC104603390 [Nelumbo nucifera]